MFRHMLLSLSGISVLAAVAVPASSQDLRLSISAGAYNPGGADFEDTASGPGFDAVALASLSPRFELGAGAQWNAHGVSFSTDDWDVISLFVEPRIRLGLEDANLQPFVAGRLGWMRKSLNVRGRDRSANGVGLGGLAGLGYQATPTIAFELAVTAYYLSFGDLDEEGVMRANSSSSGNTLGLRLGLVLTP